MLFAAMRLLPGSPICPRSAEKVATEMPVWFEVTTLFRSLKNGAWMPMPLFDTVDPLIVRLAFFERPASMPTPFLWKREADHHDRWGRPLRLDARTRVTNDFSAVEREKPAAPRQDAHGIRTTGARDPRVL